MKYYRSHVGEDIAIGLCYYTSRGRHIECRIKHGEGSFQVEEVIREDVLGRGGKYVYRLFKPWGVSSREVEEAVKKYGARLVGRKDKYSDAWIHIISNTRIYKGGYTLVGRIDESFKPEDIHLGNRFRIKVLIPREEEIDDVLEIRLRNNHIHGYKALKRGTPPRLERIKYEAIQSYLFNISINNLVKNGVEPPPALPLLGYATPSRQLTTLLGMGREEILRLKRLFYRLRHVGYDFYGGLRNTYIRILEDIGLIMGDGEVTLEFMLGRGEYATILLREIFKPLRPRQQGF